MAEINAATWSPPHHRRWASFALHAVALRWRLALSLAAFTAALAWAAVATLPKSWHAEALLLSEPDLLIGPLGNPGRPIAAGAELPAFVVSESIRAHDNLEEVVRRTDLLRRWDATRAPAGRLVDAVRRSLRPVRDEDRREALIDMLQASLYVDIVQGTLRIGVTWPDRESAYRIVQAVEDLFLAQREAREAAAISEAIAILDKHAAQARRDVDLALSGVLAEVARSPRMQPLGRTQDLDTQRVALMLSARRRAIETIEEQRRGRVGELQARIAERRAALSGAHPEVLAMAEAVQALVRDSPELVMLREEEAALAREYATRAGQSAASLQPGPAEPRTHEDPSTDYARARLRTAMARHELLLGRIDSARLELDVTQAAFKFRYAVIKPAQMPRRPVKPDTTTVIAGALLLGLLVAVSGATIAERREIRVPARTAKLGAAAAAVAAACVGMLVASSNVVLALAPVIGIAALWAIARFPLRWSLAALMFLVLAVLGPDGASGLFHPPWEALGPVFQANLNKTLPIDALRFTGTDVVVAAMALVAAWRYLTRSPVDGVKVRVPPWFAASALASLAAVAGSVAWGVAQGGADGNQILWQVHQIALVPIVALIGAAALRGPQDFALVGRVVLAAAMAKALQAIWVRWGMGLGVDVCPTATTHADSVLFAVAFFLLLARLYEERSKRAVLWALICLPPLAAAMQANYRRLVWVEVVAVVVTMYFLAPRTRAKLRLTRGLIALSPVVLLYVAAGMKVSYREATGGFFAPVGQLMSIIDSRQSRSTAERDIENYNLVNNAVRHPLIGLGFGHEYTSYTYSDDISKIFPQWKYIPHNSVLGLFAFGGLIGFFGYWIILIATVYLAARANRVAVPPVERIAALGAIGAVLAYLLQCYGDMGFVSWNSVFLLGPGAAVAAKLAASSGAWPAEARR